MKIGAVIQARMSSTRLPGKVLKELPYGSGITVLEQIIDRLKKSKRLDDIVVATSTKKDDDEIVRIAKRKKVKYLKGSLDNVLSRYYLASKKYHLDLIVRITGDCPCVDPALIDSFIKIHIKKRADYTSNTVKRSYPRGLDVEVFNFSALEKAHRNAGRDYEREHVTPYFYKNPRLFKIVNVKSPRAVYGPDIRITLDTEEDYTLLSLVYGYLYRKNRVFTTKEIASLFKKKPLLKLVNKEVIQKR
ncbi:cytidylyltransferase domain-containing protein [Candidatus Omnitrophota bacterium]